MTEENKELLEKYKEIAVKHLIFVIINININSNKFIFK